MAEEDIDILKTRVESLVDRVKNANDQNRKTPPSIYRVPSMFRKQNPLCFNPRVVSIGPLHSHNPKMKEFEVYKEASVHDFLYRLGSPEKTLRSCMEKVTGSVDRIKGCYAEKMTCEDIDLAQMMVMDACFILEFIYKFIDGIPVVRNMLLQQSIIYDLLLLENQIPFFVLNGIYECTIRKAEGRDRGKLSEFIFPFLNYLHIFSNEDIDIRNFDKNDTHDHILGFLHQCYWPRRVITSSEFLSSSIHSAVYLDNAGVNFKPNKDTKWSMAMEVELHRIGFWDVSVPTFRMPVLHIHDYTELILRNLMAYEQSSLGINFVTSYVIAMDMLVNTEEDIATLVKSKVLINNLGSNVEAANMINGICKEVSWIHFFYSEEWSKLNSYCDGYNGFWPKHIARLSRTYFGSPWSIIALAAGIVLFVLTVLQTIYAMKEGVLS